MGVLKKNLLFYFSEWDDFIQIVRVQEPFTEVTIPERINKKPVIQLCAYSIPDTVTALYLPDTVQIVDPRAFSNAARLKRISIPAYLCIDFSELGHPCTIYHR